MKLYDGYSGVCYIVSFILSVFELSQVKLFYVISETCSFFWAGIRQVLSSKNLASRFLERVLHPHCKCLCKGIKDLRLMHFEEQYSTRALVT